MSPPPRTPSPPPPHARPSGALLLPPALVLVLALLGSISVHVPIYAGLGVLADLLERAPPPAPPPIEISLLEPAAPSAIPGEVVPEPDAPTEGEETETAPAIEDAPQPARRRRPLPRPERAPEPAPAPEPTPQVAVAPQPPTPPPPPPPLDERRAIVQRSEDPSAEPDHARFIADEARDVDEETVAAITNTLRDDPEPSPGEAHEADAEEPGDSDERVAADMRDVEGDDRRRVLPDESERRPQRAAEPSTSPRPTTSGAESLDPGDDASSREGARTRTAEGGTRAMGGGDPPEEEIMVSDGFGTFTITRPRPRAAEGAGAGDSGGARREGRGLGERGEGLASGSAGRARGGARRGSEGRRGGPQIGITWSQFESIYGEEELRRAREARLEERRSRSRGASRERRWQEFRAAIENYVSEVRPGNQTALDAAASPFATFLSDMHRRIHREFADRYLAGIPLDSGGGLNDMSLQTTLEIAVNEDGTIHRVGMVATSGNILYDFGAFNAVMRAQPFPAPPDSILSRDGRAWLHWRFDRGPRQCGTWNARPFILENSPLVDRGEPPEPPAPAEHDE